MMRIAERNESLEILIEQAKSVYHTRLNNLTHQTTKAGIILTADSLALGIVGGLIKSAGINLSGYALHAYLLLVLASIVLCFSVLFYKNSVPILDIKAALKNIDRIGSKKEFMNALISTYDRHTVVINKIYRLKVLLNLLATVLTLIAFGIIIVHVPAHDMHRKANEMARVRSQSTKTSSSNTRKPSRALPMTTYVKLSENPLDLLKKSK